MFRFNWPTSELMFGQYFSMFCEWYAESAEDGPLQMTGTPTARLAQVRFTQTFAQDWTVAALIGDPNQAGFQTLVGPYNANINNGQSAETPQVQGKVEYAHDFWGKAAYYGKPTPFTIQFVGGWQRNVMRTRPSPPLLSGKQLRHVPGYQRSEPVCQPLVGHGVLVHSGHPDSLRQSGRHRLHPDPVVDRPGRRGLWVYRHVGRQIRV